MRKTPDDRRQRQDEALYSRALESIDLNRSTFCSTLHRFIWQRPPLFELSQQEECNTTAERAMGTSLCASLQAMSLHQVSDSAGVQTQVVVAVPACKRLCCSRAGPPSEALNLCCQKLHLQYDLQKMHFQRGPTASAATTAPSSVLLLLLAPDAGIISGWLSQRCSCRH